MASEPKDLKHDERIEYYMAQQSRDAQLAYLSGRANEALTEGERQALEVQFLEAYSLRISAAKFKKPKPEQ